MLRTSLAVSSTLLHTRAVPQAVASFSARGKHACVAQAPAMGSSTSRLLRGMRTGAGPIEATPRMRTPDQFAATEDPEGCSNQGVAEGRKAWTARYGVLATLSRAHGTEGFPSGSVVEFVTDEQGRPVFAVSTMSPHTADMVADGRCSLTVTAAGFKSLSDGRHTVLGRVTPVPEADQASLRELYLKKHPDAFYVDFGDFKWFIMSEIAGGRSFPGFGRAGKFTAKEYANARPDPVAAFAAPVCSHMNADHEADTLAMIAHYVGMPVESAKLVALDRLGVDCEVRRQGSTFKLRLPFVHPAEDRKGVKDVIVEMTKAARAAAQVKAMADAGVQAPAQ